MELEVVLFNFVLPACLFPALFVLSYGMVLQFFPGGSKSIIRHEFGGRKELSEAELAKLNPPALRIFQLSTDWLLRMIVVVGVMTLFMMVIQ